MGIFKKTKARLVRPKSSVAFDYIEVTLPDGEERHLFKGSVRDGAKGLSPNERKKVIADCEKQIDGLKDGNCPTTFREMLSELKNGKFKEDEI